MAHRTRAERRHENKRILAKRYRQDGVRPQRLEHAAENESEWRYLNPRKRLHTGKVCSCPHCRNVRSKYGNSVAALTFQELVALDHLRERE